MHFQGKALALLDWHWGKMRMEDTKRRGSVEQGVYDVSVKAAESDPHRVSFGSTSADPVIIHSLVDRDSSREAVKPLQSPHGELAQSSMSVALRHYFAGDSTSASQAVAVSVVGGLCGEDVAEQQSSAEVEEGDAPPSPSGDDNTCSAALHSGDPDQLSAAPGTSFSSSPSVVVKSACSNQAGRAMFVKCLNRQRSLETKIRDQASFDALVDCFDVFLSECIREDDVKAAKTAMILAETFYLPKSGASFENGLVGGDLDDAERHDHLPHLHNLHYHQQQHHHGGVDRGASRMYLQEEVKRHAIWKNPSVRTPAIVCVQCITSCRSLTCARYEQFWEKALLLAIGEELQKTPQHAPWEDLPSGVLKQDGACVGS